MAVLLKVSRAMRAISTIAAVVGGVMELRRFYFKRKHMWNILRRLVRQLG